MTPLPSPENKPQDSSQCQPLVGLILLVHLVVYADVHNIIYHVCNMMVKAEMFLQSSSSFYLSQTYR